MSAQTTPRRPAPQAPKEDATNRATNMRTHPLCGLWTLALAAALGACGGAATAPKTAADTDSSTAPDTETATDAATDAATDVATDAATDTATAPDTVTDTAPAADAAPDAGPESDAGPDALPTPGGPTVGGCSVFPADNMWNTPIDDAPVHPQSAAFLASMGAGTGMHPDFGTQWQGVPNGIPITVVPADQAGVDVSFLYADESDPGPYPIPPDVLIEGGPSGDGDRHVLLVQQGTCTLFELFNARPPDAAGGPWTAGSGAVWDLHANQVRPAGWTSADAAGLAILPGLVRYQEAAVDGEIHHALRITLSQIRRAYVPPASHSDGQCGDDPACPPMGLRLRLRADFDVAPFTPPVQAILRAMKRYGLVVADTGGDLFLSGEPNPQWDDDALHDLNQVTAQDLEAVFTGDAIPY